MITPSPIDDKLPVQVEFWQPRVEETMGVPSLCVGEYSEWIMYECIICIQSVYKLCERVCATMNVCVCVCACVRACVRACVYNFKIEHTVIHKFKSRL